MSPMMYQAYQNTMDFMAPWRSGALTAKSAIKLLPEGLSDKVFGRLAAAFELISRTSPTYARHDYDIKPVIVGNGKFPITAEDAFATPVGCVPHFKKQTAPGQP